MNVYSWPSFALYFILTDWAFIVIPLSLSISILSKICSSISLLDNAPVSSISLSASVDFPWSMCATMLKFLIYFWYWFFSCINIFLLLCFIISSSEIGPFLNIFISFDVQSTIVLACPNDTFPSNIPSKSGQVFSISSRFLQTSSPLLFALVINTGHPKIFINSFSSFDVAILMAIVSFPLFMYSGNCEFFLTTIVIGPGISSLIIFSDLLSIIAMLFIWSISAHIIGNGLLAGLSFIDFNFSCAFFDFMLPHIPNTVSVGTLITPSFFRIFVNSFIWFFVYLFIFIFLYFYSLVFYHIFVDFSRDILNFAHQKSPSTV